MIYAGDRLATESRHASGFPCILTLAHCKGDAMKNVADIAVEVEKLVQNQDVRTRFLIHIDKFFAMAESYGKALQPYSNKLTKAKVQIEQYTPKQIQEYKDQRPDSPGINLYDVCPPPEGWKQTNNICCNYYFELSEPLMEYHPGEPVNPILWLGTCGDSIVQREPLMPKN
jgi:hypothetical protein